MHDSHCHIQDEPLMSNIADVIDLFVKNNGKHILVQGTDLVDFADAFSIAERFNKLYPRLIQTAIGLHPSYFQEITVDKGITDNLYEISQKAIDKYNKYFADKCNDISAIGETGLDYYGLDREEYTEDLVEQFKEIQKISLRNQLRLAKEHNLPLSLHVRGDKDCVQDALRLIAEEGNGVLRGSFHSYTGDIDLVEDILNIGFCIGFNAIITYKSGQIVRDIIKKVPLNRILFETDAPFLPPQSVRKNKHIKEKFSQPYDVKEIIQTSADVLGIDSTYLEDNADDNYNRVFLS